MPLPKSFPSGEACPAGQAGTPQSAALTALLAGEPRSFRAGVLAPVSRDGNLSKKELTNLFFYSIIPKLSVGSTNRAAYGEVA